MEFNALDAQREACEAYVASQKAGSQSVTVIMTAESLEARWIGLC